MMKMGLSSLFGKVKGHQWKQQEEEEEEAYWENWQKALRLGDMSGAKDPGKANVLALPAAHPAGKQSDDLQHKGQCRAEDQELQAQVCCWNPP